MLANVNVGDWIHAKHEYLPGIYSDGGIGVITALINLNDDPAVRVLDQLFATVRYNIGTRVEHSIEMKRLTVVPMPFKAVGVTLRKRKVVEAPAKVVKSALKHTPLEWLKLGLSSRIKHEKKGWLLRQLLIDNNELHPTDEAMLWKRVISDFRCQESYREGMKSVRVGVQRPYLGIIKASLERILEEILFPKRHRANKECQRMFIRWDTFYMLTMYQKRHFPGNEMLLPR